MFSIAFPSAVVRCARWSYGQAVAHIRHRWLLRQVSPIVSQIRAPVAVVVTVEILGRLAHMAGPT